ncbi:MAG: ketopantoate reductase family protein [Anaerolineales bacterium]|nr:ketopantoate reductase family protein [Anaerolineales bacterium]
MKVLIVGAGIIGSIYGWAFAQAGHEVLHLVRPGKAAQFADGLKLDMYDARKRRPNQFIGRYAIRLTETLQPSDGYELILVPTKHYHLVETLQQIVPLAGEADFLLLTQNWGGTQAIDAILPPSRYLYGDAKAGGAFQNGVLVATIAGVDIGQVGGRQTECLKKAEALFKSAHIPATVHANILHYLWVQYALTGGLWPALVRAGSFEAVLRDAQTGRQAMQAARECLRVIAGRGVQLKQYPETHMYLNTSPLAMWIAGLVIQLMFRFNKVVQRSSAHGLGDAKEVSVFFFDLLNAGREQGLPMPAMSGFEPDIRKFAGGVA